MSVRSRVLFVCLAVLTAPLVFADSSTQVVDSRADKLLRDMGEYLKSANEFSFRTEVNYDRVLESGQKILYGREAEVAVRRPDGLHVLVNGDLRNERIWYDGKTFTIMDLSDLSYARVSAPPGIDDTLDLMARRYGIASPIADVVYADPYQILMEHVVTGSYIGQPLVRGVPTHHLAFTQDNIDWQLWIEDGAQPVPRKAVITYKNVTSSPQFTVWLTDWNFAPRLAGSLFEFVPPDGAQEVELEPVGQ